MRLMRTLGATAVLAGCLVAGIALATASAGGDPQGSASSREGTEVAYAKPTNLKVLPKDIPAAELRRLMERYGVALGVSCSYCHAESEQTARLDYASDDKPEKLTARLMITMLRDINGKYLSQLGDPRYPVVVGCGSCHQGQSAPPTFEPGVSALTQR
jgi:Photosynthetic reaction centre cytochrome C subunit